MLVFACAIKSKRSLSSERVRKIHGYPDKAEIQTEMLEFIDLFYLWILRVYVTDSICKQKFEKLKIAWPTLEP